MERLAATQVVLFIVGASWAFGGNADWVRPPLCAWGSLGIALALAAVCVRTRSDGRLPSAAHWVWPVAGLNAVVLASGLFPGFRTLALDGDTLLLPVRAPWWEPTSTVYPVSLRALWLFDGVYFSCLGLALCVHRRRTLRIVAAAVCANAVALAVFGIIQKAVGSTGIYFGAVASPNTAFFASFVYDNHWGAFMILMCCACIGLTLRYARGIKGWGFLHGPALAGFVGASLLAVSVPLSGSRACTLILALVAAYSLAHGFPKVLAGLHVSGLRPAFALVAVAACLAVASVGVWAVVGESVRARAEVTREQIVTLLVRGGGVSRKSAYRDTWRMARQKPLFGWGMASYPTVFPIYNSQVRPTERLPIVYHDAHSDWLQSLAELGIAGTLLILAAVALPARQLLGGTLSDFPRFLLIGCSAVALYAAVEFPFGNVAIVLSWWACFMTAVQYVRLSGRTDAEEAAH
jgi:O-antigen ligase